MYRKRELHADADSCERKEEGGKEEEDVKNVKERFRRTKGSYCTKLCTTTTTRLIFTQALTVRSSLPLTKLGFPFVTPRDVGEENYKARQEKPGRIDKKPFERHSVSVPVDALQVLTLEALLLCFLISADFKSTA